jgi:hypothetical protein
VPEARVELARAQGPLDFESSASTSFTTPAAERNDYSEPWFAVSMLFSMGHGAWGMEKKDSGTRRHTELLMCDVGCGKGEGMG